MSKSFSLVIGFLLIVIVAISGIGIVHITAGDVQKTVLYFTPDALNVQLGQSFNLSVCIANVQDLTGWVFSLSWNSSVIELSPSSSSAVVEGSFLKSQASTNFHVPQYDVGTGHLSSISCTSWLTSVSGNGTLLIICFRAVGFGETSIMISDVTLSNKSPWTGIFYAPPETGRVTVGPIVHDVAVSMEAPLRLFVNDSALVNATVVNLGTVDEPSVNVSILINNTVMTRQNVLLRLGSPFKLSSLWIPSLEGTYVVAASADPVVNETRLDDNYKSVYVVVAPKIHDIAVFLACSNSIIVNQIVPLNITVANLGAFNETGIKLGITINGAKDTIDDSWVIAGALGAGSINTSCYRWTPTSSGQYSISVYAYPMIDDNLANNIQDLSVEASSALTVLIVSNEGGSGSQYGTSLKEFESALDKAGQGYDVWIESVSSPNGSVISMDLLKRYGLVIWTSGDYGLQVMASFECNILEAYFRNGGNIIFEGERVVTSDIARGFDLPKQMLYVNLKTNSLHTTGIVSSRLHLITQNLTSPISWARTPTWGPDAVEPFDKGFTVMSYQDTNFSAVTVVDGSEIGTGSVVYYSFSLSCLPESYRDVLVGNTIDWLYRFGVSVVVGNIVRSPINSVYFLCDDPNEKTELEFDAMSAGMLYSISTNEQIQRFGDTVNYSEMSGKTVCLFGNIPSSKIITDYNASGILPVVLWQDPSSPNSFELKRARARIYRFNIDSGKNSTFVVQVFKDPENITYLVVYSVDWKGMWAAGICISKIIAGNLRDYSNSYFVFNWEDKNGDSTPQIAEISLVTSG